MLSLMQCNVWRTGERVERNNVFQQTKDKNSAFQSISEYLLAKYAAESVLVVISNPMLLLLCNRNPHVKN